MKTKLHIGIDATCLSRNLTGLEVTVHQYLKALINIDTDINFHLFYRTNWPDNLVQLKQKKYFSFYKSPFKSQLLTEQVWLPWIINKMHLDCIHFCAFPPSLLINKPFILTVHDDVPWKYSATMSLKGKAYFKFPMKKAIKKAKAIITDTNFHKETLAQTFCLESHPYVIALAPWMFNKSPKEGSLSIKKPYLLTVGSLEPRKNLPILLEAFTKLKKQYNIPHQLVIVGRKAWIENKVFKTIQELARSNQIVLTGYVKEDVLASLYIGADLFIFPSKYEGFGLPPLEAMSLGCPVLSSDSSCLPEVLGNGAEYFENGNIQSLQTKFFDLLNSNEQKKKLSVQGKAWIQRYNWNKTALQILKVYKSIAANSF